MVEWSAPALILAHRPHGEQSVLVSVLTQQHGKQAGLVRGGKGRAMRGVLQIGNVAEAVWRARLEEHLGTMTAELITPYASMVLADSLRLCGLSSVCAIVDGVLPEREPQPAVYDATLALVEMLCGEGGEVRKLADSEILGNFGNFGDSGNSGNSENSKNSGNSADLENSADSENSENSGNSGNSGNSENSENSAWLVALIRWEVAMLAVAGYGLDLSRCAVTGARQGLAFVSPRTGVAVTRAGAGVHAHRLLRLPRCLGGVGRDDEGRGVDAGGGDEGGIGDSRGDAGGGDSRGDGGIGDSRGDGGGGSGGNGDAADIADGLALTGYFLAKKVFAAHHRPLPHARQRLAELVERDRG